jgi:hypothetical protein
MTETNLIPFHHHLSPLWDEFSITGDCQIIGKGSQSKASVFFQLKGPLSRLMIPSLKSSQKQGDFVEGLWQNTCFEVFLRPRISSNNGESNARRPYIEFNLSPSGHYWYMLFEDYRKRDLNFEDKIEEITQKKGEIEKFLLPQIEIQNNQKDLLTLQASLPLENILSSIDSIENLAGFESHNLCAITFLKNAQQGEELNHWALKHLDAEKADFHLF